MSKRLSSIFGISKDKEPEQNAYVRPPATISSVPSVSPSGRLQRHQHATPSTLDLAPPPLLQDSTIGRFSGWNEPSAPRSDTSSVRSRPQTPTHLAPHANLQTESPESNANRLLKKRSFIPREKQQTRDRSPAPALPTDNSAWIAGLKEHIPYDLSHLLAGHPIQELWDERADVLVYLFPAATGRGPSFRVPSDLFRDSSVLDYLYTPLEQALQPLSLDNNNFHSHPQYYDYEQQYQNPYYNQSPRLKQVYLPLDFDGDVSTPNVLLRGDDLELLVLYRNLFAFLGGGALISTPRQSSLYAIFMGISTILRRLGFANEDGSTWGDLASTSFAKYCSELALADVRPSREKNIEAIILGEQMRSWQLYNEGFVHAAGRLGDIKALNSSKMAKISPVTINRLERASLDVQTRVDQLRTKLSDFGFPSMFTGIANSQTATEAKLVRFKAWRAAFVDMRKFTLAQYKKRYGSWPPKASSKKNNFEESGLNRLVVQHMYMDFCDLYDMLANPRELTTRKIDLVAGLDDESRSSNETIQHAIRVVLSEYDRCTPPVKPPIPFDTPLIPALDSSFRGATVLANNTGSAKLKSTELNEILLGSYNREYIKPSSFVQEFIAYERRLGAGATLDELIDNRCGQWLFLYAVLQALPMTVVDARDLEFTDGVEYYLFASPRGGKPWVREDTTSSRAWYNVKSGGQTLGLSSDVLDHQPEGIYRRSHCWLIANQWVETYGLADNSVQTPLSESDAYYPLPPLPTPSNPSRQSPHLLAAHTPPHLTPQQSPMIRPLTPKSGRNSAIGKAASYGNLNTIQPIDAPTNKVARPSSTYNPTVTFDSILGGAGPSKDKKKGR